MPYIEPYGVFPFGLVPPAVLALLPFQPPAVLAELVDYGETDPAKPGRTPTFEIESLTEGMHPIDEQVLVVLTRVKNSGAAVQNDGNEFDTVRKNDRSAPSLLESLARNGLKRLVDNGDIDILSVPVTQDGDGADLTANFRNLRAKETKKVRSLSVKVPAGAVTT